MLRKCLKAVATFAISSACVIIWLNYTVPVIRLEETDTWHFIIIVMTLIVTVSMIMALYYLWDVNFGFRKTSSHPTASNFKTTASIFAVLKIIASTAFSVLFLCSIIPLLTSSFFSILSEKEYFTNITTLTSFTIALFSGIYLINRFLGIKKKGIYVSSYKFRKTNSLLRTVFRCFTLLVIGYATIMYILTFIIPIMSGTVRFKDFVIPAAIGVISMVITMLKVSKMDSWLYNKLQLRGKCQFKSSTAIKINIYILKTIITVVFVFSIIITFFMNFYSIFSQGPQTDSSNLYLTYSIPGLIAIISMNYEMIQLWSPKAESGYK